VPSSNEVSAYTFGHHHWWRQAVVYQVYPRSFADANGDGLGDLRGVTSRVAYLKDLGVDAVWLSPFYPSALADGGYDVDDYRDVDPRLGTLADFDEMVAALHEAHIKVFVDIVPNHSSDWPSHFGPTAWTRTANPDGTLGQWYLHLFASEQPDFNWDNREVQLDFLETLRFWADRGVDGFRIDVAHALKKDLTEPLGSRPVLTDMVNPLSGADALFDRDEVHEVYREWRQLFDEYDPPRIAVAEAWVTAERRVLYARADELGQAFNFDLLETEWDAAQFHSTIAENLALAATTSTSSTWVLSNHDVPRHATRYGLPAGTDYRKWLLSDGKTPPLDRALGARRARAATMLILALPGSTYLYQGEELGLFEVADIPHQKLQDPIFSRMAGAEKGRDGCRVPLPWKRTGASFGFGDGTAAPHLPQPPWFSDYSVEAEDGVDGSSLELYRAALTLRHTLQSTEIMAWKHPTDPNVLNFVRSNGWQSLTNFGSTPYPLPAGRIVLASGPLEGSSLPPDTTAWLVPE